MKGSPATSFPVGPGSLIGHPRNLHHTLVGGGSAPVKWYSLLYHYYIITHLLRAIFIVSAESFSLPLYLGPFVTYSLLGAGIASV